MDVEVAIETADLLLRAMSVLERGAAVGGWHIVGRHWDASLGPAWVARQVGAPSDAPSYLLRVFEGLDGGAAARVTAWAETATTLPETLAVARTEAVAEDGARLAVVSELVLGETLRQSRRAVGRWPVPLALAMVRQVTLTLEALYDVPDADGDAAGRAHGHVGADRVLLDYETHRLVLLDPGLDAAYEGRRAQRSDDVLGLGRLLFELITGQPGETCPAGRSPIARASDQRVPRSVEALVACATAPDPTHRHANPAAFLRDLDDCLSLARQPVDLPRQLAAITHARLATRVQGTRVLVGRWRRAPSIRGRPSPRPPAPKSVEAPRAPRLPPWAPEPPAPQSPLEARPLAEPALADPQLRILPPVQPLVVQDTEDLAHATADLPRARPDVVRLMRQLSLLGLLMVIALCAHAYFDTPHGAAALRALWTTLTGF